MIVDDSLYPSIPCCQDYQIIFGGISDDVLHLILLVLEPSPVSRTSCQILHEKIRSHQLSCKVTAYDLRPNLLDKQHPYLIANGFAEQRLFRCRTTWEVIIDHDEVGPPVCVKPQHVETDRKVVVLEDVDYLLRIAGVFSDGC